MLIRAAEPRDAPAIGQILLPIVRAGETLAMDRGMSEREAVAQWAGPGRVAFVAEAGGEVLGVYYIRPNQGGGGSHVCNCGYATAVGATGRGVGRAMCEHSLVQARLMGYRAVQFNFVVSSNARAVALWRSCGFAEVGRLPGAFLHPTLGCVDALVMFRAV
ncbi:MAG: GNAT family N-acetyltransferase [Phycisphaerales bacterium]